MPFIKSLHITASGVYLTLLWAIISFGLLSCEDDWNADTIDIDGSIAFTIADSDEWHSRSEESDSTDTYSKWGICVSSEPIGVDENGDTLYLHKYVKDGIDFGDYEEREENDSVAVSRASMLSGISEIDKFWVKAAYYIGDWSEDLTMNLMDNEPFAKDSNGLWRPSTNYLWPGGPYKTRLFAYYPQPDGEEYTISEETGTPIISCSTPRVSSSGAILPEYGTDIVAAYTGDITGVPKTAPVLQFKHLLTAIKFVIGKDAFPGILKTIEFSKIYLSGEYDMTGTKGWTTTGESTYIYYSPNIETDPGTEIEVMPPFFVIPQQIGEMRITLSNNSLTGGQIMKGTSTSGWDAGKTITYVIDFNKSTISAQLTVTSTRGFSFGYIGSEGVASLNITSRAIIGSGSYKPYDYCYWEFVEQKSDNSYVKVDAPSWLNFEEPVKSTTSDAIKLVGQFNIEAVPPELIDSEDAEMLKGQSTVGGSNNHYSLAGNGSANCYMISAPGYYKFPVVYGNALNGSGGDNTSAYLNKNLRNYSGNVITKPWISDDTGVSPKSAKVLWQDSYNLVTDVSYNSTDNYIEFTVDSDNICPGNAVIAVYDSNDVIMWSWHIWVTALPLTPNYQIAIGSLGNVNMLNAYLGECPPENLRYDVNNKVILHVWQTMPDKVTVINEKYQTISQYASGEEYGFFISCPSYQAGRKDPMRPVYGDGNAEWSNKTVYSDLSNVGSVSNSSVSLNTTIQNPQIVYIGSNGSWTSQMNYSSWNTGSYYAPKKSIYDPCPPGYRVPYSDEFCTNDGGECNYELNPLGFYMYWDSFWDYSQLINYKYISMRTEDFDVPQYMDYTLRVWTSNLYSSGGLYFGAVADLEAYAVEGGIYEGGPLSQAYPVRPVAE